MSLIRLAWPLLFGFTVASCVVRAPLPKATDEDGPHRIIHAIVTDSLIGGGYRENENFFAVDSTSLALLNLAKVPVKRLVHGQTVQCPGGINENAEAQVVYGYWVRVRLEPIPDKDSRTLTIYKSCKYVNPGGRPSGFYEGGIWEIDRVNGVWRIVRAIDRVIT